MIANPAECRIDPRSGVVLFQSEGELEYERWESAVRFALDLKGGRFSRALSDRRRLSEVYRPDVPPLVREFLLDNAQLFTGTRWALLMGDTSAAHTAANLSMPVMEAGLEIRVFLELRPALQWLGVDEELELTRLERWVNTPLDW